MLGWLTQRYVEQPLLTWSRRSTTARRGVVAGLVIAAVAVVVASDTLATASKPDPQAVAKLRTAIKELSARAYDLPPCTGALAGPPTSAGPCGDHQVRRFVVPVNLIAATQRPIPCRKVVRTTTLLVVWGQHRGEAEGDRDPDR